MLKMSRSAFAYRPAVREAGKSKANGLVMSDLWFLSGVVLASIFSLQPGGVRLDLITATKNIPLVIAVIGLIGMLFGNILFRRQGRARNGWALLTATWPLLILGLWILTGSLLARSTGESNITFMNMGLYMFVGFLIAWAILEHVNAEKLATTFVRIFSVTAIFMVLHMIVGLGHRTYHENEFATMPLAVYFALRNERLTRIDICCTTLLLLGTFLFFKNTGIIVGSITFAYLWLVDWRHRFWRLQSFRWKFIVFSILGVLAALSVFIYLHAFRSDLLPSGNAPFRLQLYGMVLDRFVASPLWGSSFLAPPAVKFTGFDTGTANNVLPTHSDLVDIFGNGGLIGTALWILAMLSTIRTVANVEWTTMSRNGTTILHCLACFSVCAVATYAVNPILGKPTIALVIWTGWGLLMGFALQHQCLPKRNMRHRRV